MPLSEYMFVLSLVTFCAFITYTIHEIAGAVMSWYEELF